MSHPIENSDGQCDLITELRRLIDRSWESGLRVELKRSHMLYRTSGGVRVVDLTRLDVVELMFAHASATKNVHMLAVIFSMTKPAVHHISKRSFIGFFLDPLTADNAELAQKTWDKHGILAYTHSDAPLTIGGYCLAYAMKRGWPDATRAFAAGTPNLTSSIATVCLLYSAALRDGRTADSERYKETAHVAMTVVHQSQDDFGIIAAEAVERGVDESGFDLILRLMPYSRRYAVIRFLISGCSRFDSDQGAMLLRAVNGCSHDMLRDDFSLFQSLLTHGLTYLATKLLVGDFPFFGFVGAKPKFAKGLDVIRPSMVHSACRALIASAFYHGLFGWTPIGPRPNLWSPLKQLARVTKMIDIRYIGRDLIIGFVDSVENDEYMLARGFQVIEAPSDCLLCPHRFDPGDRYIYQNDRLWQGYHVHQGDLFVRITELFRPLGVRIVVSEQQCALRSAKYRLLCLVVAAWLKRLGLRSVSVRCVARDMIAGWL